MKIKKNLFALFIFYALTPNLFAQVALEKQYTLNDARKAYQSYNIKLGEKILNSIWTSQTPSTSDKVGAGKYLSDIYSRFLNKNDKAKTVLQKVIELNPEDYNSYLRYSQLLASNGNNNEAIKHGLLATQKAKSMNTKIISYSSLCNIVLSSNIKAALNKPQVSQYSDFNFNIPIIEKAIKNAERVIATDINQKELLKTKFALEVLAGKGKEALATWKNYFQYSENSSTYLKETYKELEKVLGIWNGGNLTLNQKKSMVLSLALMRDYDLAMVFVKTISKDEILKDSRINEVVAYYRFLTALKKQTQLFYQSLAQGKSNPKTFRDSLIVGAKELWKVLKINTVQFAIDNFQNEIDKRFGAAIRIGNPNGWYGISWGHKIDERKIQVNQYGKKGKLVFKNLDYIISNGYISWYFNNSGAIGGWQSRSSIYQLRPGYLLKGQNALKLVKDSLIISQKKIKDNKRIHINATMLEQIKLRANLELLKDLKAKGLRGRSLENEFIKEFDFLTYKNDIEFHEGRHFIDKKIAKKNNIKYEQTELEFKAKLSEIAFAKYPFMALASILDAGVDNSAHGKANKKLVEALCKWITENSSKIKNYESNVAVYLQLNKLSNKQLVAFIKSVDTLDDH